MATIGTKLSTNKRIVVLVTEQALTLSAAQLDGSIFELSSNISSTLTLPTGGEIEVYTSSLSLSRVVFNTTYEFYVRNLSSAGTITFALPSDGSVTADGNTTLSVSASQSIYFLLRISSDSSTAEADAVISSYQFIGGNIGSCVLAPNQVWVNAASGSANGLELTNNCNNYVTLQTATSGGTSMSPHVYTATFPDNTSQGNGVVLLDNSVATVMNKTMDGSNGYDGVKMLASTTTGTTTLSSNAADGEHGNVVFPDVSNLYAAAVVQLAPDGVTIPTPLVISGEPVVDGAILLSERYGVASWTAYPSSGTLNNLDIVLSTTAVGCSGWSNASSNPNPLVPANQFIYQGIGNTSVSGSGVYQVWYTISGSFASVIAPSEGINLLPSTALFNTITGAMATALGLLGVPETGLASTVLQLVYAQTLSNLPAASQPGYVPTGNVSVVLQVPIGGAGPPYYTGGLPIPNPFVHFLAENWISSDVYLYAPGNSSLATVFLPNGSKTASGVIFLPGINQVLICISGDYSAFTTSDQPITITGSFTYVIN